KLLDTSAIIDGRIIDVVKTGFIEGELAVPQFVLDELQLIADSTDSMKRDRGQRGLEMLHDLQESSDNVNVQPVSYDKLDVDHQLVQLAKEEKDRKSTRLNSSHVSISYAVFCLKKKTKKI